MDSHYLLNKRQASVSRGLGWRATASKHVVTPASNAQGIQGQRAGVPPCLFTALSMRPPQPPVMNACRLGRLTCHQSSVQLVTVGPRKSAWLRAGLGYLQFLRVMKRWTSNLAWELQSLPPCCWVQSLAVPANLLNIDASHALRFRSAQYL